MIWLIIDVVDTTYDDLKANHIINDFFNEEDNISDVYLDVPQLTAYLNHARGLTPSISESLRDDARKLYHTLRDAGKKNDGLAIGTRQLEGIMRLAYAHAKLMLKDEVDSDDLKIVTNLLKSSYKSLNVDLDSGESLQEQLVKTSDGKFTIIHKVWRLCEDDKKIVISKEFIQQLVDTGKFTKPQAQQVIATMSRDCEITDKGKGLWKKTVGVL